MISACISEDIHIQIKLLNNVIPILMHFCSVVSNWSVSSRITKCDIINYVKLFTYTVANLRCFPIKCRVTKASALEKWFVDLIHHVINADNLMLHKST